MMMMQPEVSQSTRRVSPPFPRHGYVLPTAAASQRAPSWYANAGFCVRALYLHSLQDPEGAAAAAASADTHWQELKHYPQFPDASLSVTVTGVGHRLSVSHYDSMQRHGGIRIKMVHKSHTMI
jgi:hypothetical protein